MKILALLLIVAVLVFLIRKYRNRAQAPTESLYHPTDEYAYTQEDKYNLQRRKHQLEIDRLLDKIAKSGMSSLSEREKQMLNDLSK